MNFANGSNYSHAALKRALYKSIRQVTNDKEKLNPLIWTQWKAPNAYMTISWGLKYQNKTPILS